MKKLLLLLLLIPAVSFAQQEDTACRLDIYGCYVYSIKAFLNGNAGLAEMHNKQWKKKTETLYVVKDYYTGGLPETMEDKKIKYLEIAKNKELLYEELKTKKGALVYMSELNITADVCDLWLMPIQLEKKGEEIEPVYTDLGCHIYFQVCKYNSKLGYIKTVCPTADKP